MIDLATWRPRIRREPDPRQIELFAERIARDEAAGLRTRIDQLQARGLWARPRNKR